jgi:two-component system chemotaxis response regulator CheB
MEPDPGMQMENRIAMTGRFSLDFDTEKLGSPSGYTCPDCNGSLTSVSDNNFRCRVGHAWSPDALLSARDAETEGALWVAVRSLQEKAKLARRLAERAGRGMLFDRYSALAEETEAALAVLTDRLALGTPRVGDTSG